MLRLQFAEGQAMAADLHQRFIAPKLIWQGAPASAKSLTLWLEQADAARPLVYWLVFNLPAKDGGLGTCAGALPPGARLGSNSFGSAKYRPPCQEKGEGRIFLFWLAAVDQVLPLSEGVTLRQVQKAMHDHVLEKAVLEAACGHT